MSEKENEYSLLNKARDYVHNWDASPCLECFVNSHPDDLENHVALVIESERESQQAEIELLKRKLSAAMEYLADSSRSYINDIK